MSTEKLTDWAGKMPLKNDHLNEPNVVLRRILRQPGVGEVDLTGKQRLRVPPILLMGLIVAAGPSGEANYADERYWVRLARPKPAATDAVAIDFDPIADSTFTKPDGTTATYKPIFTVTNLTEVRAHSHHLQAGDPVVFAGYPDGHQPTENLRYVMAVGGAHEAGEFYGMTEVTDPDLVLVAEFLPLVDEPPV